MVWLLVASSTVVTAMLMLLLALTTATVRRRRSASTVAFEWSPCESVSISFTFHGRVHFVDPDVTSELPASHLVAAPSSFSTVLLRVHPCSYSTADVNRYVWRIVWVTGYEKSACFNLVFVIALYEGKCPPVPIQSGL